MSINFYDVKTYDYNLPDSLIAQNPVEPRDSSRMLLLHRSTGEVEHKIFRDVTDYLIPGDLLILNDTKVIAARLHGIKQEGSAEVEILLLRPQSEDWLVWHALVRPGRRLKPGTSVKLPGDILVEIEADLGDGVRRVVFPSEVDVHLLLTEHGEVPLPPYIHNSTASPSSYQTVFAREEGSAAAPTAGLHFTGSLIENIRSMGVDIETVTLHVGLGTFRPVKVMDIRDHTMHEEHCTVPLNTFEAIARAKREGRRVIAVGTTVVRTLESMAAKNGVICPGNCETSLFIYPGFNFRVIDGVITNFHLPQSTLLMLVSAFAGYENTMKAYQIAVKEQYRFFSFGDSMLII